MHQKTVVKKLKLAELNIPQSELIKLIESQNAMGSTIIHDTNSYTGKILSWAYFSKKIFTRAHETQLSEEDFDNIYGTLNNIEESAEQFMKFINFLFTRSSVNQFESLISKPKIIFDEIASIFKNANVILDKKASRTLEFVYPEMVLEVIIRECFTNAVKHNTKKRCEIVMSWSIKDNKFFFEIHDNGKGIIPELPQELLPFRYISDTLYTLGAGPRGLRIINGIIRNSNGNLFISRSKKLGGTMIAFNLPTFAYYKDGYIYETK